MKRSELIRLKKMLNQEIERRKRINELLEEKNVKEYLELIKLKSDILDSNNIRKILSEILENFKVTETNKIYVCTQAYYVDCRCSYQDTDWYTKPVDIDSKYAEHKIYKDIESNISVEAVNLEGDIYKRPSIEIFEKENIVFNPTNTNLQENNYNNVRIDFFENAVKYGQSKSKQMILKKYPRI